MKRLIRYVLLISFLIGVSLQARVMMYWDHPTQFRDFRISATDTVEDVEYLILEFEKFARKRLENHFSGKYQIYILIEDIDMAGGFSSGVSTSFDSTRVIGNSSSARLQMRYEIQDLKGKALLNGVFDKRGHRILPISFHSGVGSEFPFVCELFDEWVAEVKRELAK